MGSETEQYEMASCVRGYHVYRHIWAAAVGEVLECQLEPTNVEDRYAVGVVKDETIVRHLPKRIARVCSLFLRRGGTIMCTVQGSRRYSSDLVQGGLEVPCTLLFIGKPKEIKKLKSLAKKRKL